MSDQKKLVSAFKQFVEKALIPNIKGSDSMLLEWQYFYSMLNQDNIDYNKLQIYLDVLTSAKSFESPYAKEEVVQKSPVQKQKNSGSYKKREEGIDNPVINNNNNTFNPSRTFGGERSRFNIFPKFNFEEGFNNNSVSNSKPLEKDFHKKDQNKMRAPTGTSKILNSIQIIYKTLLDNQHRLEQTHQKPDQKKYF